MQLLLVVENFELLGEPFLLDMLYVIYVAYNRPNGLTDWATIYGWPGVLFVNFFIPRATPGPLASI